MFRSCEGVKENKGGSCLEIIKMNLTNVNDLQCGC